MDENIKKATRQSYGEALLELGKENKNIVVFDADLSTATKTNIFAKEFPERFYDMGIAEQYHMQVHLQYLLQEEHMTKLEIVYVIQN